MKVSTELYNVYLSENSTGYQTKVNEKVAEYNKIAAKYESYDFITIIPIPDDLEEGFSTITVVHSPLVLTKDQIMQLTLANISLRVEQMISVEVDITEQLVELAEKPIKLVQESHQGDVNYNTRCEVHMPNMAMSMYNEMLLLENACTDELQGALNSGWRIVAACPQPDQRRPDYILGRFNPNMDSDGSARRSK